MSARQPRRRGIFDHLIQPPDPVIPEPPPQTETETGASKMSSAGSLLRTLIVPALISLALYILLSYLLIPIWRRYRNRYSQYLPIDRITTRTTSLRHRLQGALVDFLLPSSWRSDFNRGRFAISPHEGSDSGFDDDEGEELFEVDDNRREALSLDARRGRDEDGRRLSRELEEGFKDDSDDEEPRFDERLGNNAS